MTTQNTLAFRGRPAEHHLCFLIFGVLSLIVLWAPLARVFTLALHDDRYSHLLIVPLISVALVCLDRKTIFSGLHYSPLEGAPLFLGGIMACWLSRGASSSRFDSNQHLSLIVCGLIATWMAGFVLCYGTHCFHTALFPSLFLLLMIPLPVVVIDKTVLALQKGSAAVAYGLFRMVGVPVLWSGFKFELPGVNIEIAKECSGIRSSISLLITGIVAGHVFLKSGWRKIVLSLLTVPIAIVKNAVRIVTISWLGVYVNPDFLYGKLHHYGGVPFALIGLAILAPTLLIVQKTEATARKQAAKLADTIVPVDHFESSMTT
jgi:exosortase